MKRYLLTSMFVLALIVTAGCTGDFVVKSETKNLSLPLTGIQNVFTNVTFRFYVMKKVALSPESVTVKASSWAFTARSDTPVTFQIKISSEDISDTTDYLMVFDTTGLSRFIPSYLLQPFLSGLQQLGYSFRLPSEVNRAPVLVQGNVQGVVTDSLQGSSNLNSTLEASINKGEMWVIVTVTAQSNYFPPITSPTYMHMDRLTGHIEVEMDMSFLNPLIYMTF